MQQLIRTIIFFALGWLLPGTSLAHSAAEAMAEAAAGVLKTLSPDQRAKAVFLFANEERGNWHFIPKSRAGLSWGEMTPDQRELAKGLLASGLSSSGMTKATNIMALETILADLEGPARRNPRDPQLYFLSIFGEPGAKATWGWRVEGHHLSINITVVDGKDISVTPSFMGSNPAEVKQGPQQGLRILAGEEDLGRALVTSLTPEQRKLAILEAPAPRDIITGNARKAKTLEPAGIPAAKLGAAQNAILLRLVKEYVHRYRPEMADDDLAKIQKAGWDQILFAWAGSLQKDQGHYYRVQGPTFLLEYDNTQNNANHIHSVWRNFENDFGEDLLRRHYEKSPHR